MSPNKPRNSPPLAELCRLAALLLILVQGVGCAGYNLGPTNGAPAGSRSVQINFFQNKTTEPRLSEAVVIATRRAFQQDGTFLLDTKDSGSITVSGVIDQFDRSGVSFRPNDIITVRDYALEMGAQITAMERSTGRVVFEGRVHGRTTIRAGNDLYSAERQALPLLAEDMARNLVSRLADGTW